MVSFPSVTDTEPEQDPGEQGHMNTCLPSPIMFYVWAWCIIHVLEGEAGLPGTYAEGYKCPAEKKKKKMCWPYFTWDARERGPWVALSGAFLDHSSIVNNEVLDISITPQQMLSLNLNESGEHSSNHHSATRWNTSHY